MSNGGRSVETSPHNALYCRRWQCDAEAELLYCNAKILGNHLDNSYSCGVNKSRSLRKNNMRFCLLNSPLIHILHCRCWAKGKVDTGERSIKIRIITDLEPKYHNVTVATTLQTSHLEKEVWRRTSSGGQIIPLLKLFSRQAQNSTTLSAQVTN